MIIWLDDVADNGYDGAGDDDAVVAVDDAGDYDNNALEQKLVIGMGWEAHLLTCYSILVSSVCVWLMGPSG